MEAVNVIFERELHFLYTRMCHIYYVTTYVQANYPIIELCRCIENFSQLNFMHLFKTVSYSGLSVYVRTYVDMCMLICIYILVYSKTC